jgi:hypothetical protein
MSHNNSGVNISFEGRLLAVDLGLKTGLALYGQDGKLCWYRSQNFGTARRLKSGVHGLLGTIKGLRCLVLEGGGRLALIWEREAKRLGISVKRISAEQWRGRFLYPREQRSGIIAKRSADELARRIIDWSGAVRPKSLRHDTAEAIMIGLWGVLEMGWLDQVPEELRH